MLGAAPRVGTNMRINNHNVKAGTCWLVESPSSGNKFVVRIQAKLFAGWTDCIFQTKEGSLIKVVVLDPQFEAYWTDTLKVYTSDELTCISKAKFNMLWKLAQRPDDEDD